jgi:hypothetical protein
MGATRASDKAVLAGPTASRAKRRMLRSREDSSLLRVGAGEPLSGASGDSDPRRDRRGFGARPRVISLMPGSSDRWLQACIPWAAEPPFRSLRCGLPRALLVAKGQSRTRRFY